ncbi:MAG: hypothetical protein LZF62_40028 [Nitrospira sp.]|nr:MAG: hypothetical protein LZF62_40028 [Nitrospira sp.]
MALPIQSTIQLADRDVLTLQKGVDDPFSLKAPILPCPAKARPDPFNTLVQAPFLPAGTRPHRHRFHSADSPSVISCGRRAACPPLHIRRTSRQSPYPEA